LGGVGLAKRRLAETRIIQSRYDSLPDFQPHLNDADGALSKAVEQRSIGRVRMDQKALLGVSQRLGIDAQVPVHVIAAGADCKGIALYRDMKAFLLPRRVAETSHDVASLGIAKKILDRALLIGIGIERDASLLLQHSRVVLVRIEAYAAEVAPHRSS